MENTKPVVVTEAELKEIAQCLELQESCGFETAEEFYEDLTGRYIAKFPRYITDGPGYVGEMFVIVWGIPAVTMLTRDHKTNAIRIEPDCD